MSNKSRLQTNNTSLQELIDKANALPDANGNTTCNTIYISDTAPDENVGINGDIYILRS